MTKKKSDSFSNDVFIIMGVIIIVVMIIALISLVIFLFSPKDPTSTLQQKNRYQSKKTIQSKLNSNPQNQSMRVYYVASKDTQDLHRFDISEYIGDSEIKDIFHINKPLFSNTYIVLDNGNVYGLTKNNQGIQTEFISTDIPIEKLKIVRDRFYAISKGNVYYSDDFDSWEPLNFRDTIQDISFPSDQSVIYFNGANHSYVYNLNNGTILETDKEKRVYGQNQKEFVSMKNNNNIETSNGVLIANKLDAIYDSDGTLNLLPKDLTLNGITFDEILGSDDLVIYKGYTSQNQVDDVIEIPKNRVYEFFRN